MDSLGWNSPSVGTNALSFQQSIWNDPLNKMVERSLSSGAYCGTHGGKKGLSEDLFFPTPGFEEINASNSVRVRNVNHQMAFPSFAPSSTELHIPVMNMPYTMSPLISSMPPNLQVTNGMEGNSMGLSMGSLESLDCLLSTTNSNTDTSVEDDGISMILPDCKNLWSFNSSSAISAGESENNGLKEGGKDPCQHGNNPEETVSQCSSNPCNIKPSSSKRSKEQEEIRHGVNYRCTDIFQSDSSTTEVGFKLISENPKKPRLENQPSTSNINFQLPNSWESSEPDTEAIAHMKEMIYRAAVFRPVNLGLEVVEKPKRKNVRISSDPQTVAARQRRERISERIRVLQRLVPGGSKMDTASMLDEAANYLKFLRSQVKALENLGHRFDHSMSCTSFNLPFSSPLLFGQGFPCNPYIHSPNPNQTLH